MSNLHESNISPFDFAKIQLMGQLSSVADSMRKCADIAEHFSQLVAHLGGPGALQPMTQYPTMPEMTKVISSPQVPGVTEATNGKRKAKESVDGEIKKKKPRKPRDPDAPKRPASSYLLFQNEVRQAMKKANPNMDNHQILVTISQRWSSMTKEEKDTYHKRQEMAKAQYNLDKSAYDARKIPGDITQPDSTMFSPAITPAAPPSVIKHGETGEAAVGESSEESSSSDDDDDSSSDTSEEEDEVEEVEEPPVQKKAKKASSLKTQPTPPSKKEKEMRKKVKA